MDTVHLCKKNMVSSCPGRVSTLLFSLKRVLFSNQNKGHRYWLPLFPTEHFTVLELHDQAFCISLLHKIDDPWILKLKKM